MRRSGEIPPIFGRGQMAAVSRVVYLRLRVENIGRRFGLACRARCRRIGCGTQIGKRSHRRRVRTGARLVLMQAENIARRGRDLDRGALGALSAAIVDRDAGLDVVQEDIEGDRPSRVLRGIRLQLHPVRHQLVPMIDRRCAVEDVIRRARDETGDQIFKRPQPLRAEKAGAGEDVACVRARAGKRRGNELADRVQIAPVDYVVIAHTLPADGQISVALRAQLRRVGRAAETGRRRARSAESVELAVPDVVLPGKVVERKGRDKAAQLDRRRAVEFRNVGGGIRRRGNKQRKHQQQRQNNL